MSKMSDSVGQTFGRLTVLRISSPGFVECQCVCGVIKPLRFSSICRLKAPIKSCGCLKRSKLQPANMVCRVCNIEKPREEFYIKDKKCGTRSRQCKACFKKYEKVRGHLYRRNNVERRQEAGIRYRRSEKIAAMRAYSGPQPSCACPGCSESRIEFLSIDHIDGGGTEHRKQIGSGGSKLYSWLRKNDYPSGYRVLCHNCNQSYGSFGYCPHNGELATESDVLSQDRVFNMAISALNATKNIIYTKEFNQVVLLLTARHSCITGVGKASLAAQKLACTLASNGVPSTFSHATELLHGNLGAVANDDIIVAFSNSGKTNEIAELIDKANDLSITIVVVTGNGKADPIQKANVIIDYGKIEEACSLNLTPTTSFTVQQVIADSMAMAVQNNRGLTYSEYSNFHGGGYLGYISKLKSKIDSSV